MGLGHNVVVVLVVGGYGQAVGSLVLLVALVDTGPGEAGSLGVVKVRGAHEMDLFVLEVGRAVGIEIGDGIEVGGSLFEAQKVETKTLVDEPLVWVGVGVHSSEIAASSEGIVGRQPFQVLFVQLKVYFVVVVVRFGGMVECGYETVLILIRSYDGNQALPLEVAWSVPREKAG